MEMDDELKKLGIELLKSKDEGLALMGKLVAVAQPSGVYGEPLTSGEHTVITASEVSVGMGFGFGGGGGTGPAQGCGEATSEEQAGGFGSGGGGGGVSAGRPVAVIEIGPNGVQVKPVIDVTKTALAFFTTFGAMFIALGRMSRAARH
jgi:uncharacterized spore protein YtfJ